MSKTANLLVLGAAASVLLTALGLQAFRRPSAPGAAVRDGWLVEELPRDLRGWRVTDLPLGPNESVQKATRETLRYDDYVYRRYAAEGVEFSTYVARWSAGKMPVRLIAEHTPDRCWVENGWRCRLSNQQVVAGGSVRAEFREYDPPDGGARVYVWFWMIAGGRQYDFTPHAGILSHAYKWWRGVMQEATASAEELLFVRVTSSQPFEKIESDPGFQTVVQRLLLLGRDSPQK